MVKDVSINEYLGAGNRWRDLHMVELRGQQCGLLKFRSGWLATEMWLPISEDRTTFLDFMQTLATWRYKPYWDPAYETRLEDRSLRLLENVFILGGGTNYYHNIIDNLPRLVFFQLIPEIRHLPIVIPDDAPDSFHDILQTVMERIGLDPSHRLIPVASGELFRLKNAFVPSRIWHEVAVEAWREYLAPPASADGPERIFVVRNNVRHRRLLNQDAVSDSLQRFGFTALDPGSLSFPDQVSMFSSAHVVVGVHGAGLANIVFSPAGGTLLELHTGPRQPFYSGLAEAQRFRYLTLSGQGQPGVSSQDNDFTINIEKLEALLTAILRGTNK